MGPLILPPRMQAREMPPGTQADDLQPTTPEGWSEIWDSTPEKESPPIVQQAGPRSQVRRTGQKSRFYKESAGPILPGGASRFSAV